MTNEQLAVLIQAGGADELIPLLWEKIRKLMYMKSERIYATYKDKCDGAGVDAWDIKQACYSAFLQAVKAYKPSSGFQFTTYLQYPFKTAFNDLLGIRTTRREPLNECTSLDKPIDNDDGDTCSMLELLPDDASADAYNVIEERDDARMVHAAVERLSDPIQRQVITMYFFEGMTYKAVGERLCVSGSRAQQIGHKALQELRKDPQLRELYVETERHKRWVNMQWLTMRPDCFAVVQELQERPDWQSLSYGQQQACIHSRMQKLSSEERESRLGA